MTKRKITLVEWDHTCADGCCYTWGTDILLDDSEVGTIYSQDHNYPLVIETVLKGLGIENIDIETVRSYG